MSPGPRTQVARCFTISLLLLMLGVNLLAAAEKAAGGFSVGQDVEVKRGTHWHKANIVEFDGTYYKVKYTDSAVLKMDEWVQVERIRKPGDTRDIPFVMPTPHGKKPGETPGPRALGEKPAPAPAADASAPASLGSLVTDAKAEPADIGSAKQVTPGKQWTYHASGSSAVKLPEVALTVPGFGHASVHAENFVAFSSPETGLAFISQNALGSTGEDRVDVLDLKAGKVRGSYALPAKTRVAAASPSGKRVAVVQAGPGPGRQRVDIFDLAGQTPRLITAFLPFGAEAKTHEQNVRDIQFVDDEHVLAMSDKYRIVLFSLPEGKTVYSLRLDGRNVFPPPVLSPDHQHFVVEDKDGFYFYEALTGTGAGTIEFPVVIGEFSASNTLLLLSSDGKRLARSYAHGVQLFSLEGSPRKIADFLFPQSVNSHKKALWVSPDHLLVDERWLIDLQKEMVLWQYELPRQSYALALGARTYVLSLEKGSSIGSYVNAIRSVDFPDDKVLRTASSLDSKSLFATSVGDKVTLNVKIGNAEADKVLTEHFTKELKEKGYVLADHAPLRLEVSMGDYRKSEREYSVTGKAGTEKVNANVKKMAAQFVLDGKVIWEARQFSGTPMVVNIKSGQTLESAIKEEQADDWHQLEAVSLPRQVPVPRDPPGFGKTDLTGDAPAVRSAKPKHI